MADHPHSVRSPAAREAARRAAETESAAGAALAFVEPQLAAADADAIRARETIALVDRELAGVSAQVESARHLVAAHMAETLDDAASAHLLAAVLRGAWGYLPAFLSVLLALTGLYDLPGASALGNQATIPGATVRVLSVLVGLALGYFGLRVLSEVRNDTEIIPLLTPFVGITQRGLWVMHQTRIWRGMGACLAALALVFGGFSGWIAFAIALTVLGHAADLLIGGTKALAAFRESHLPLRVERFVVRAHPVNADWIEGVPLDDGASGFAGAPEQFPMLGASRLAPGDVVMFVGPASRPMLAYTETPSGAPATESFPAFDEGATPGLTARWLVAALPVAADALRAVYAAGVAQAPAIRERQEAEALLARATHAVRLLEAWAAHWEGLYLPLKTMRQILGTVDLFRRGDPAAPSGLLFDGSPGTGKTEVGRRLAASLGSQFVAVTTQDMKQAHVGGTEEAVKALWANVRAKSRTAPVVLFVDECDGAFPSRSDAGADQFAKSITEGFLSEWQGMDRGNGPSCRVLVVGATNHNARIDSAILSRFGETITIPAPSAAARRGMLASAAQRYQVDVRVTDAMVDATQGLGGRDLDTVMKHAKRDAHVEHARVDARHVLAAASALRGRNGTAVASSATWDRLVLAPEVMEQVQTVSETLRHAEVIARQGVSIPRGLLFYGPPGTGKTQLARTIANESGLTFIALTPAELKAAHVGGTAIQVANAFRRAREASPAILYLDEIDTVAPTRGGGNDDAFTKELVGQLLQEIDGAKADPRPVFVLASTNRVDQIDAAVLLRFTDRIEIPLPSAAQREAILDVALRSRPIAPEAREAARVELARRTEGYSGRDLEAIVTRAEQRAVRRFLRCPTGDQIRVSMDDILSVV